MVWSNGFLILQGRKESWFIPTKLATNLSVSLSDSSSRKQVYVFLLRSSCNSHTAVLCWISGPCYFLLASTTIHRLCYKFTHNRKSMQLILLLVCLEHVFCLIPKINLLDPFEWTIQGFVVVETNFRMYAYSSSKLHCEILRLFSRYYSVRWYPEILLCVVYVRYWTV